MNKVKLIVYLLVSCWALFAGAKKPVPVAAPKVEPAVERTSSFSYLLTHNSEAFEFLKKRMPEGCAQKLQELYISGQTLRSETLEKAALSILNVRYASGHRDARFFHWTNANSYSVFRKLFHSEIRDREKAHELSLKEGAYDEIYLYLRANTKREQNAKSPSEMSLWNMQWYVAEDDRSSRSYGDYLLEIIFADDAKVLNDTDEAWKPALEKLGEKYPELVNICQLINPPTRSEDYGCGRNVPAIYFIVAEDSYIDMINYDGCGSTSHGRYFQVLSPQKIIKTIFN